MAAILLIEDEPKQAEMIVTRLAANGYEVRAAENAEKGIKFARAQLPDLILMDILLPGMSGLVAIKELKKSPLTQEIPIIAITAVLTAGQKCIKAGACDVIRKPYDDRDLLEKIERALESKESVE